MPAPGFTVAVATGVSPIERMIAMLPFLAMRHSKVVVCVTCCRTSDGSHEHVTGLTLRSPTGHDQQLSLRDVLAQLRHPVGERYSARAPESGAHADLVVGACPHCREDPYLRLTGGGRLEDLPRCH